MQAYLLYIDLYKMSAFLTIILFSWLLLLLSYFYLQNRSTNQLTVTSKHNVENLNDNNRMNNKECTKFNYDNKVLNIVERISDSSIDCEHIIQDTLDHIIRKVYQQCCIHQRRLSQCMVCSNNNIETLKMNKQIVNNCCDDVKNESDSSLCDLYCYSKTNLFGLTENNTTNRNIEVYIVRCVHDKQKSQCSLCNSFTDLCIHGKTDSQCNICFDTCIHGKNLKKYCRKCEKNNILTSSLPRTETKDLKNYNYNEKKSQCDVCDDYCIHGMTTNECKLCLNVYNDEKHKKMEDDIFIKHCGHRRSRSHKNHSDRTVSGSKYKQNNDDTKSQEIKSVFLEHCFRDQKVSQASLCRNESDYKSNNRKNNHKVKPSKRCIHGITYSNCSSCESDSKCDHGKLINHCKICLKYKTEEKYNEEKIYENHQSHSKRKNQDNKRENEELSKQYCRNSYIITKCSVPSVCNYDDKSYKRELHQYEKQYLNQFCPHKKQSHCSICEKQQIENEMRKKTYCAHDKKYSKCSICGNIDPFRCPPDIMSKCNFTEYKPNKPDTNTCPVDKYLPKFKKCIHGTDPCHCSYCKEKSCPTEKPSPSVCIHGNDPCQCNKCGTKQVYGCPHDKNPSKCSLCDKSPYKCPPQKTGQCSHAKKISKCSICKNDQALKCKNREKEKEYLHQFCPHKQRKSSCSLCKSKLNASKCVHEKSASKCSVCCPKQPNECPSNKTRSKCNSPKDSQCPHAKRISNCSVCCKTDEDVKRENRQKEKEYLHQFCTHKKRKSSCSICKSQPPKPPKCFHEISQSKCSAPKCRKPKAAECIHEASRSKCSVCQNKQSSICVHGIKRCRCVMCQEDIDYKYIDDNKSPCKDSVTNNRQEKKKQCVQGREENICPNDKILPKKRCIHGNAPCSCSYCQDTGKSCPTEIIPPRKCIHGNDACKCRFCKEKVITCPPEPNICEHGNDRCKCSICDTQKDKQNLCVNKNQSGSCFAKTNKYKAEEKSACQGRECVHNKEKPCPNEKNHPKKRCIHGNDPCGCTFCQLQGNVCPTEIVPPRTCIHGFDPCDCRYCKDDKIKCTKGSCQLALCRHGKDPCKCSICKEEKKTCQEKGSLQSICVHGNDACNCILCKGSSVKCTDSVLNSSRSNYCSHGKDPYTCRTCEEEEKKCAESNYDLQSCCVHGQDPSLCSLCLSKPRSREKKLINKLGKGSHITYEQDQYIEGYCCHGNVPTDCKICDDKSAKSLLDLRLSLPYCAHGENKSQCSICKEVEDEYKKQTEAFKCCIHTSNKRAKKKKCMCSEYCNHEFKKNECKICKVLKTMDSTKIKEFKEKKKETFCPLCNSYYHSCCSQNKQRQKCTLCLSNLGCCQEEGGECSVCAEIDSKFQLNQVRRKRAVKQILEDIKKKGKSLTCYSCHKCVQQISLCSICNTSGRSKCLEEKISSQQCKPILCVHKKSIDICKICKEERKLRDKCMKCLESCEKLLMTSKHNLDKLCDEDDFDEYDVRSDESDDDQGNFPSYEKRKPVMCKSLSKCCIHKKSRSQCKQCIKLLKKQKSMESKCKKVEEKCIKLSQELKKNKEATKKEIRSFQQKISKQNIRSNEKCSNSDEMQNMSDFSGPCKKKRSKLKLRSQCSLCSKKDTRNRTKNYPDPQCSNESIVCPKLQHFTQDQQQYKLQSSSFLNSQCSIKDSRQENSQFDYNNIACVSNAISNECPISLERSQVRSPCRIKDSIQKLYQNKGKRKICKHSSSLSKCSSCNKIKRREKISCNFTKSLKKGNLKKKLSEKCEHGYVKNECNFCNAQYNYADMSPEECTPNNETIENNCNICKKITPSEREMRKNREKCLQMCYGGRGKSHSSTCKLKNIENLRICDSDTGNSKRKQRNDDRLLWQTKSQSLSYIVKVSGKDEKRHHEDENISLQYCIHGRDKKSLCDICLQRRIQDKTLKDVIKSVFDIPR